MTLFAASVALGLVLCRAFPVGWLVEEWLRRRREERARWTPGEPGVCYLQIFSRAWMVET